MQDAAYYRAQAQRARRVGNLMHQRDVQEILMQVAQDYDDIAEDLEVGAIEIRHPELLPQRRR